MPKVKPDHLSKETYDLLKGKVLKDYMAWDKSLLKPEQQLVNSLLNQNGILMSQLSKTKQKKSL